MTDQVLDILKLVLLALLYLFFARVLWAVWSEVRQPANARGQLEYRPPSPAPPPPDGRRPVKPARGKRGRPARLVVLEPKERKGTTFAIVPEGVGIGREADNTVVVADDAFVSGHHAKITGAGEDVIVHDLASRNGTYLNGSRIEQPRIVQRGDRIQVGYTVLEAQ